MIVVAAVDPDGARDAARDILRDDRFRPESTPRPLRGPLEWFADRLRPIGRAISDALDALPGPPWLGWLVLAAAVALVLWLVLRRTARRGTPLVGPFARRGARAGAGPDAAALDAEADAAERRGEYDLALRLRFRAGLLRLGACGAIEYRESLTDGAIATRLDSPTFDDLARSFEEVAYGGRPAQPTEVHDAKVRWPGLVREASRR